MLSRRLAPLALLFFFTLGPSRAAAQSSQPVSKAECATFHGESQVLRKKGALLKARDALVSCARAECPAAIQKDCVTWAAEVDAILPTVVFRVRGDDGDIIDVEVAVDGKPLLTRLEGKSVPLDPGAHAFKFTVKDKPPVERNVLLTEGDKGRAIEVSFASAPAGGGGRPPKEQPGPDPSPPPPPADRPVPILVYALGAGAIVGLGSFTVFALTGSSKESDLDACAPFCASADVSSARTSYVIADISLGAAIVLGAASAYFYFTRPEVPRTTGVRVTPFGLTGRF